MKYTSAPVGAGVRSATAAVANNPAASTNNRRFMNDSLDGFE
jgi:hypothetical protein